MKIVCEHSKCTGCLACVVTCIDHHYSAGAHDAVSPRRYTKAVLPSGYTKYDTYSCRHCENAPCAEACPTRAIHRDENGWVRADRAACTGCGLCTEVCPFHIPRLDRSGKMVKCDGCGGAPNCVRVCPNGALSIQP